MLKEALILLRKGFSVVAARKDDKRPISNWTEYQKRLPTEDELQKWFKQDPTYNIGFITGTISGFYVIDIEASVDLKTFQEYHDLPSTASVKTGGGGLHLYYKCPKDIIIPTKSRIFGKDSKWTVDIRGEGGFIVCPPSIHVKTGKPYEWSVPLSEISEGPTWIIDWIKKSSSETSKFSENRKWEDALEGVNEGNRNDTMTSYAGKLMLELSPELWNSVIPAAMKKINDKFNPPLPEHELSTIYNSIRNKEVIRRKNEEPEQEEPDDPQWLEALYKESMPDVPWIVQDLVPARCITVLSSPPGYFKTWILLEIAIKVSSGQKVFNHFDTESCGVLIVNEENWKGIIQDRLKALIPSSMVGKLKDYKVCFYNQKGLKLTTTLVDFLIKKCKNSKIGLIMFDSLIRVHNFDENSASEIKKIFEQMKKFTLEGIAVLFTHHHRKQGIFKPANPAENMRGSTDIAAMVDTHLCVDKRKNSDDMCLVIGQPKQRLKENLSDFKVRIEHILYEDKNYIKFMYDGEYSPDEEREGKIKEGLQPVAEFIGDHRHCSRTEIEHAFKGRIGSRYIGEIIVKLEDTLVIKGGNRPKKYFLIKQTEDMLEVGQQKLVKET